MRKGKRFTPTKLENWQRNGRGAGVFSEYQPWHQVTRADPASRGRSHLANWSTTGRTHHYLSDGEAEVFGFISMLQNVIDIREQFPLSLHDHPFEAAAYNASASHKKSAGTLAIAEELGIRHPTISDKDETAPWIMSTDFLVALENSPSERSLLAISYKLDSDLLSIRKRWLLLLENLYWQKQNVEWLLISPSLSLKSVRTTLRTTLPWGVPKTSEEIIPLQYLHKCAALAPYFHGKSLTTCLNVLIEELGEPMDFAQRTFWQAVWKSLLPIDLARPWNSSVPIHILEIAAFIAQNPIASRRSICL
ncbi:MAG: TnsA endonuclease N-terminal domain-containing protein [Burkholderiaceae bacterium]